MLGNFNSLANFCHNLTYPTSFTTNLIANVRDYKHDFKHQTYYQFYSMKHECSWATILVIIRVLNMIRLVVCCYSCKYRSKHYIL